MELQIDLSAEAGIRHARIELAGEVDLAASPKLRDSILAQLAGGSGVMVRLADVTYIDSSGIACLVEGYQKAKTDGLLFSLVEVGIPTFKVLKLARLDQIFPIYESYEAALKGN